MNKQEAIEKIKEEWFSGVVTSLQDITDTVNQIDEPQKPVIPKYVAEWIEECKRSGWHLQKVLSRLDDDEKVGDWAYDENDDLIPEKVDMIARAWLDGYEIEQEKLYTVEIPDPNSYCYYRYLSRNDNGICIDASNDAKWKQKKRNQFTEAEIRKDFDWAWQWAKPVEEEL